MDGGKRSAKKYAEKNSDSDEFGGSRFNVFSDKKNQIGDTEMNVIAPMDDPFNDIEIFMDQIQKEDAENNKTNKAKGALNSSHDNSNPPLMDIKELDELLQENYDDSCLGQDFKYK